MKVPNESSVAVLAMLVAGVLAAGMCEAAEQTAGARIPFVDLGGIRDWRADGERGLFVESNNGDWYYAEFVAPCLELKFRERVGFVTEPGGSLDKFSSVIAGNQRCYFRTFEPSAPPG